MDGEKYEGTVVFRNTAHRNFTVRFLGYNNEEEVNERELMERWKSIRWKGPGWMRRARRRRKELENSSWETGTESGCRL